VYEGPRLDALLERIHEEAGPDARILKVDKVRSGGIAGFFQRERFEVAVDLPDRCVEDALDRLSTERIDNRDQLGTSTASIDDLADRVDAEEAECNQLPSTATRAFKEVMRNVVASLGADQEWPASAAEAIPLARRVPRLRQADAPLVGKQDAACLSTQLSRTRVEHFHASLARLGLPEWCNADASTWDTELEPWVTRSLERLPKPPELPREGGSVIAVVGEAGSALAVGAQVGAKCNPDHDGVILASAEHHPNVPAWMHLRDVRAATSRRRGWHRRRTPVVVAVSATPSPDVGPWAARMLEALEPSLTLGVVDARLKVEDIAEWTNLIGGLDAIALEHASATTSPAAVLHLNVPVMYLDGRVATAARWAAILTRRLRMLDMPETQ
jgi:hypothetical protein